MRRGAEGDYGIGMRRHLIITVAVLAVIAAVVWSMRGEVDPATSATAPHLLLRHTLPDVLPPPHEPTLQAGDAAPLYRQAVELYDANRDTLSLPDGAATVDRLVELLIDAMDTPRASDGFADAMIPMQPMARPTYGDAPEGVAKAVLTWARQRAERRADCDRCERAILAVWTFGKRMFDCNIRLAPRRTGLSIMQAACVAYLEVFGDTESRSIDMRAWLEATQKVWKSWQIKLHGLYSLRGSIGDLIRMADHDEDRTFRVEALLQLGAMQWLGHRSRANLAAIEQCLQRHAASSDPTIAEAAQAAQAFTREQSRMIR